MGFEPAGKGVERGPDVQEVVGHGVAVHLEGRRKQSVAMVVVVAVVLVVIHCGQTGGSGGSGSGGCDGDDCSSSANSGSGNDGGKGRCHSISVFSSVSLSFSQVFDNCCIDNY